MVYLVYWFILLVHLLLAKKLYFLCVCVHIRVRKKKLFIKLRLSIYRILQKVVLKILRLLIIFFSP